MHFEYPWVFLFALLFLFCEKKCPLRLDLLYFPRVTRLAKASKNRSVMQAFKWMAWSGLLIALASPVQTRLYEPSHAMGRDIVLVVDASRSMDDAFSLQESANKFEAVRDILKRFIAKRKYDRLGMVIFGEYPYVVSPVTFDHDLLLSMMPYLEVGMAGEKTAIYDALAMALKLLKDSEAKSKVAILLTDGRNSAGKIPKRVAEKLLRQYGIRLYTIGIGKSHDYDAGTLEELANATGGKFFVASDHKMLSQVYNTIDRLEPSLVEQSPVIETTYLFSYPLFVAVMSLIAYIFLLNRGEL